MGLLSARVVIPLAVVVIAWGGVHLLGHRDVPLTPVAWPAASSPAAGGAAASPPLRAPALAPSPAPPGSVPVLPGALQQLNADTRDTAIGFYGLITDIEAALSAQLGRLVQQLEPGR